VPEARSATLQVLPSALAKKETAALADEGKEEVPLSIAVSFSKKETAALADEGEKEVPLSIAVSFICR
jgi:hypothetical protein